MMGTDHVLGAAGCLLIILNTITTAVEAENILMLFHEPGSSHFHDAAIIAALLKDRGHNITFLLPGNGGNNASALGRGSSFTNIQLNEDCVLQESIDVVKLAQEITIKSGNFNMDTIEMGEKLIRGIVTSYTRGVQSYLCDSVIADVLMSSEFDMVFLEGSFLWLHGLVHKLSLPFATLTTCAASSLTNSWNHAPNLPAIIPGFIIKRHQRRLMPFMWRVYNTVNIFAASLLFFPTIDWFILATASEYVSDGTLISPTKSFGRTNVWLTNQDFSTDVPRSYMPNTVSVGGLSVKKPGALDEENQNIVEAANENGVLVVSMGTVVEGLSQDQIDAMAYAFSRLKQTVVWKEPVPRPRFIGSNTILRKWIPQNDLLGHPNVRAMVYHCGNNGAFEALYHGIPIIGIPVFADQSDVAYRIMSNGMGLVVEVSELTNETLFDAVSEVIDNAKYRDRARFLSSVYRDNPASAPERAAYWVEYILRHRGNRLMRAKVAEMDTVQEYLLDVWAFLASISTVLIFIFRTSVMHVIGKYRMS